MIGKEKVDDFSNQYKHSASHLEKAFLSHVHFNNNLALKFDKEKIIACKINHGHSKRLVLNLLQLDM